MKPRSEMLLCMVMLVVSFLGVNALENPQLLVFPAGKCPSPREGHKSPAPPPLGMTIIPFSYNDFSGKPHSFDCLIDSDFISQESSKLGFPVERSEFPVDMEASRYEVARILTKTARGEALRRGLTQYADLEVLHEPQTPNWAFSKLISDISYFKWLKSMSAKTEEEYYKNKGFKFDNLKDIYLDYKGLGENEKGQLSDCYDKLVREAAASDDGEIVALLLAAFQGMCKEFPPDFDDDKSGNKRFKANFWPPTVVLERQAGDCDSKAVALFSLWQNARPQIMLFVQKVQPDDRIKLPPDPHYDYHAFLGIEGYPEGGQGREVIRWRTFIYCEVNEFRWPGERSFSGNWERKVCLTNDCTGQPTSGARTVHLPFFPIKEQ